MHRKIQFPLLLLLAILSVSVVVSCVASEQPKVHYVQIQSLRSDSQMDHVFIATQQSVTYNASERTADGFGFDSFSVRINSTDQAFLHELKTDLYIESYDYFGGMGAWTSRLNFTITNPTAATQELFLKIDRNYIQTRYAVDNIAGAEHSIIFSTTPPADRVFVRWNYYAALTYAAVNGSIVDYDNVSRSPDAVRVEFLPNYLSFQVPPRRIQNTDFQVKLEERNLAKPIGHSYISAIFVDHRDLELSPQETHLFDLPSVSGWNYLAGAAYTNLTSTIYPQPYPFQLINMSIWDPTQNPLLITTLDTTFGVRNLSNQTWTISFDLVFYYWQSQNGITIKHEILDSNATSIVHEISVNVSDATAGADLGLSGQYLRFQVPGTTVSFEAPDLAGKFQQTYIPLRQGTYMLVTSEPRIVAEITSQVDDLQLSSALHFNVTYGGDPYADANITLTQRGTSTSRTYSAFTNENGQCSLIIHSNGPEQVQLNITIVKDKYNYLEQHLSYSVGTSWWIVIVVVVVAVAISTFFLLRRCGSARLKFNLQTQTYT